MARLPNCQTCGGETPKGWRRFCSHKCRARAVYLRFNPRPPKPCRECGDVIPAGAHANRDYCSDKCKAAVDNRAVMRKYKPRRFVKVCLVCSGQFVAKKRHAKCCNSRCLHRLHMLDPEYRAKMRANADARRALTRGAEKALKFKAVDILQRDGWRCQICGDDTPQNLRGRMVPKAPTIDHIIPLSKGGHHTPENTRCACLRCNQSKNDRLDCAA